MKLSASAGLTAAETKQCADKLLQTTKSTANPATGLLKFERDGYVSLCSPAAAYKEEGYWLQKSGFKMVDLGLEGACKNVYVHPSVPEHDIHAGSVVAGGMPLRVLLLDFSFLLLSLAH
jgi:hypothetical protein